MKQLTTLCLAGGSVIAAVLVVPHATLNHAAIGVSASFAQSGAGIGTSPNVGSNTGVGVHSGVNSNITPQGRFDRGQFNTPGTAGSTTGGGTANGTGFGAGATGNVGTTGGGMGSNGGISAGVNGR